MFDVNQWRSIGGRYDKGGAEALLTMLARLHLPFGSLVGVGLSPAMSKPLDIFHPVVIPLILNTCWRVLIAASCRHRPDSSSWAA